MNQQLFLTSSANKVLEKIVPLLPKSPSQLKVAFIPTGADPYEDKSWMEEDKNKLVSLGFEVFDLDLKNKTKNQVRKCLMNVDIVFVSGGNTFYLLEKVKQSGFDKVIKELIAQGIIYIGSSAGSIIIGPDIEPEKFFDDPNESQLNSTVALGIVDFLVVPHYSREKYAPYHEKVLKEYKDKYKFIPLTDYQMVVVTGNDYKVTS